MIKGMKARIPLQGIAALCWAGLYFALRVLVYMYGYSFVCRNCTAVLLPQAML